VVLVELGNFEASAAVSAAIVLLAMLLGSGISPLAALALFALCLAGYFALEALKKSGQPSPGAELSFIIVAFGSFFLSIVSFNAFSAALPLLFVPSALCASAIASIGRGFFSSG